MIWSAFKLSLLVVALATLLISVVGTGFGFLLAKRRFRAKEFWDAVLTLPMVLPPTVTGYYLILLLGKRGVLGRYLYELTGWTLAFTWQGAVVAAGVMALPIMVKSARAALESIDARYELVLACGALAAAEAASLIQRAVTGAGGFRLRPLNFLLVPVHQIFSRNLLAEGQCLLQLFGAYPDAPPTTPIRFFWLLHLAGVALAASGVAAAAWRLCPGRTRGQGSDLVSQLLLAGIAVSLAAFVVTRLAGGVGAVREISPVLPFAAALAARQLAPGLSRLFARPAAVSPASVPAGATARAHMLRLAARLLVVVGIGYAAGVGVALTAPTAPPMSAQLSAWLTRHDLGGYGLGGYWQSSVVTLTSGGAVAIRPVQDAGPKVVASHTEAKVAWFDPLRTTAHFDVLEPGNAAAVQATWGRPARVYHVGQYTIWYWPKNLLSTIRH